MQYTDLPVCHSVIEMETIRNEIEIKRKGVRKQRNRLEMCARMQN